MHWEILKKLKALFMVEALCGCWALADHTILICLADALFGYWLYQIA